MFVDLYKILLKEDSDSEYQLMGDSAGGFFALILAGQVNKLNLKKFENLFLNSPLISFDENEKPDNVKDPVLNYQLAMIIKQ
jgi:acetyl esterase/lipase